MSRKVFSSYAALGVGLAVVMTVGLAAISGVVEQPSQDQLVATQPEAEKIAPVAPTPVEPPASRADAGEGVEAMVEDAPGMEEKGELSTMMPLPAAEEISAAPIPQAAIGPPIDPMKGYLVEEVGDGLYWITDGIYQAIFLTTGEGVIVVDAPPSIGENYLKAIKEVTDEPVTHIVYSHTHTDHIGAASIFPNDAVIIAHEEVADQLSQRNDPRRPLPTVTFTDEYTLTVGSQTLELEYKGPIHEPGNIFIYAPEQKVLMLVDVVFPGWSPFKDLAMAEDVPYFIAAHDLILEYDFDTFIGGHLTRLGTAADVRIQKEYMEDIQRNAASANQSVDFMAIAQQTGFENTWLLIDTYMDAVTQACTDATVPDWIDRLGGVDVFTYDHCFKITGSQRID